MRRFVVLSLVIACCVSTGRAEEPEEVAEIGPWGTWAQALDAAEASDLIVRGQSPETRLPPPQLRVAQGTAIMGDPCFPTAECPPTMQYQPQPYAPVLDPYANVPPQGTSPWHSTHFGVFGEYLYLQSRNVDIPYAVPQNALLIPGATPIGPVAVADPGFNSGFRAGAFVGITQDTRVIGTYTYFKSTTDTSVNVGAPAVINPLTMFPGTFNAAFASQSATAEYILNFQFIDIDYQVIGQTCDLFWYGYSLGARYGELQQGLTTSYPFNVPNGTTTTTSTVNFYGVGPRAGLEGERSLFPNCGLRAYGKTSASFLIGSFKSSYTQYNQFNGYEVNTTANYDRIVPVLDFELGLAWVSPKQHFRVSGGYLVSAWFNTVTTESWINSVQTTSFNPGSNAMTFDGLTARAEVRF